jgi:hypothetical protein
MRSELIETNAPLVDRGRAARVSVVARIGRVIDYLFGLLYALLLIRFALQSSVRGPVPASSRSFVI